MTTTQLPSEASKQHTLALGCVVLFLLPFASVGLFTGVQAVRSALAGDWGQAGFLSIFALVFGGVGIGGIIAVLIGRRKLAESAMREVLHPAEPWLWRADWASGRIEDSNRSTMWTAWCFAALWNLISFPGAFFAVRAALQEGKHAAWIALLFPLVGVGLLIRATRATIRYQRYGVSRLELSTRPGVIGHSLSGRVHLTAPLRPSDGFQVILSCIRQVTTGSGKNRSTSERVLWQEERREMGQVSRLASGMGTLVPVEFVLPSDVEPCNSSNPRDSVLWRLEVVGSVPGVDYHSKFEVPVFRTEQSAVPATAISSEAVSVPADYRQPSQSRIQVTSNRRGTEILFPSARNPGFAAGLSAFLVVWAGIVVVLLVAGAPILFPIMFGGFALLFLYLGLDLWLGVTRVTAGDGKVTVASGLVWPTRERSFPAKEITDVKTRIGMQAGGRPYYDIRLVRSNGKEVTAGRGIRDKREAEWLAATLKQSIVG